MATDSWGSSEFQRTVQTVSRKRRWHLLAGAVAAVLLLAGGWAYYALVYSAPREIPLSVSIDAPPLLSGGVADVTVTVTNPSQDEARSAELALSLPVRTTAAVDDPAASSTPAAPVVALGDLPPGASRSVSFAVSTSLEPNTAGIARAVVSYGTPRGTRRFEASAVTDLVVTLQAATVAISAPSGVVRDDPFAVTIRYRNNAVPPLAGGSLRLALPRGVRIDAATPAASASSTWALPTLAQGQEGTIRATLVAGKETPASFSLRAALLAGGSVAAEQVASVSIGASPLTVAVTANDEAVAPVSLDQTVSYRIDVANASRETLKDVKVAARLGGSLFDLGTVQAQAGTLAASAPVVTWTGVGVPELRSMQPGASVMLTLSVRLVRATAATDVESVLMVTASSPTVPAGTVASGVVGEGSAAIRLRATASLGAAAYWRDPLGQVTNAGPQPPRVGTPTQYLVRWSLGSDDASLSDATVTTVLPPGVRFTGRLAGAAAGALSHDARTGQVTWRAGAVKAGTVARAGFQVEVTPAQNQAGDDIILAGETRLTATDAFTGAEVSRTASRLSTSLQDGTAGYGQGFVAD